VTASLKKISIKDLAGFVSSHLNKLNLKAVLTGGACVSIYSKNKYQSLDLDFVTNAAENQPKEITAAMKELGFKRANEGFFEHSDCKYIIEFIPPPLAIGREPVKKIDEIRTKRGTLKLLSPTDCVKDRLAAYYHWNDPQSLKQALMVAKKQKIDLKEIKRWSKVEENEKKFQTFCEKLNGA